MSAKVKAGTNFILPVKIECDNFSDISAIEFLFKQSTNGSTLKTAYWSSDGDSQDAALSETAKTINIFFSREDTYLFRQDEIFFMDTRIHYKYSILNPKTNIVPIQMNRTLFGSGEEVVAGGA